MVVYICCFGGVTSCFFSRHLQKAKHPAIWVGHIDEVCMQYKQLQKQYRYIIAYGPIAYLNKQQIEEMDMHNFVDHIFVCPQARYLIRSLQPVLAMFRIPLSTLGMALFGCCDPMRAVQEVLVHLRRIEDEKVSNKNDITI